MSRSRLLAALLFSTFWLGCHPSLPTQYAGNVTFLWTFVSGTCADHPEIQSVQVTIPGELLQNNGVYPCSLQNYDGIVLYDFLPGPYDFDIQAVGYSGQALFTASGSFYVNGDVEVDVDLTPAGQPASYAFLNWSFPNGETCDQVGATDMKVTLDGQVTVYNCADGEGSGQVQTPFLDPGTHALTLEATGAGDQVLLQLQTTLTTTAGSPIGASYDLTWAVGGAALSFQLYDDVTPQTCGDGGDPLVFINFIDANGPLFGGSGDGGPSGNGYACTDTVVYDALPPGTYQVEIIATGGGGDYDSVSSPAPTVTVTAGDFVASSEATLVPLYLQ